MSIIIWSQVELFNVTHDARNGGGGHQLIHDYRSFFESSFFNLPPVRVDRSRTAPEVADLADFSHYEIYSFVLTSSDSIFVAKRIKFH